MRLAIFVFMLVLFSSFVCALPYFNESQNATWIKLNITAEDVTYIKVTNISGYNPNGSMTFYAFDDFNCNASTDFTHYYDYTQGSGQCIVSCYNNDSMRVYTAGVNQAGTDCVVYVNGTDFSVFEEEFQALAHFRSQGSYYGHWGFYDTPVLATSFGYLIMRDRDQAGHDDYETWYRGDSAHAFGSLDYQYHNWYAKFSYLDYVKVYFDSTLEYTATLSNYTLGYMVLAVHSYPTQTSYIDYWGITKFDNNVSIYKYEQGDNYIIYAVNNTDNESQLDYAIRTSDLNLTGLLNISYYSLDSVKPQVSLVYPQNETHYNDFNDTIIVNATDESEISSCVVNDTTFTFNRTVGDYYVFESAITFNKNYSLIVTCTDEYDNSQNISFWFVNDNVEPQSVLFEPINNSLVESNFTLRVSYYDLFLWKTNTTLLYNSSIIYNNYSGELGLEEFYNVSHAFDVANMSQGIYTVFREATDTHTAKDFKEKNVDIEDLEIYDTNDVLHTYKFKHGDVFFKYDKTQGFNITDIRKDDRITQVFDVEDSKEKTFEIISQDIKYIEDSPYPCHLIINDNYWYDCLNMPNYKVKMIDCCTAEIKFKTDKAEKFETKSLGGLNYINWTTYFNLTLPQVTNVTNATNVTIVIQVLNPEFREKNAVYKYIIVFYIFMIALSLVTREKLAGIATCVLGLILAVILWKNVEELPKFVSLIFFLFNAYMLYQIIYAEEK